MDQKTKLMRPGQFQNDLLSRRAQQFLALEAPTELYTELATARALLSLEAERYSAAVEAGIPGEDPDYRGITESLKIIERLVKTIKELDYLDAIPASQVAEILGAMRRIVRVSLQDSPEAVQQIEQQWKALTTGE